MMIGRSRSDATSVSRGWLLMRLNPCSQISCRDFTSGETANDRHSLWSVGRSQLETVKLQKDIYCRECNAFVAISKAVSAGKRGPIGCRHSCQGRRCVSMGEVLSSGESVFQVAWTRTWKTAVVSQQLRVKGPNLLFTYPGGQSVSSGLVSQDAKSVPIFSASAIERLHRPFKVRIVSHDSQNPARLSHDMNRIALSGIQMSAKLLRHCEAQ